MSAKGFPKFQDLPVELRLMIWSFCIPRCRVYEMDLARTDEHLTFPAGAERPRELWASPSGRIPIISRVCREAREVVQKSHFYLTGEEAQTDEDGVPYPPWDAWNTNKPVRLRKGFDVVHLHWHRGYDRHVYLPGAPNPWPSFQWLAKRAAAASLSAESLHPFNYDGNNKAFSPSTTIGYEEVEYFSPQVLYYVVLAIVELHMSDSEAAEAQVFGALGEEPIQLVDPRDTASVRRFRDVWRCRQSRPPSEEPDLAEFFSRATDSAGAFCERVEQWRQELEKVWMWHKCLQLSVPGDVLAEIWAEPAGPAGAPIFGFPTVPSRPIHWTRRELNRQHPWVQTQLGLMPRFEPVLMFRHCNNMCGIAGAGP
ncbi:hypothetical protein C7999DRAFT_14464 [Corynascus novoguineensis]|uniref:2EXR domain-containing protein n=1 Tax=Corynascus novoguineensis TaxID=1126955 RepID=A0AAN7CTF2_9PEZI|nr:hypothetical protein C7999DRAFT_14464 [Corynascus novoguineensis]